MWLTLLSPNLQDPIQKIIHTINIVTMQNQNIHFLNQMIYVACVLKNENSGWSFTKSRDVNVESVWRPRINTSCVFMRSWKNNARKTICYDLIMMKLCSARSYKQQRTSRNCETKIKNCQQFTMARPKKPKIVHNI